MKRLIIISAIFTVASSCFAQTECSKSNPIFKSDNYGTPKEVYSLGSNPEFPFLRNLSTPQQVASAIKKGTNKHGMTQLNSMLMDMGFARGAKDVEASSVTAYNIPSGTVGNMGDGKFNTVHIKLVGDGQDVKAWKISASTGCYVYILAKCGNAFYPSEPAVSQVVPLDFTGATKEITVTGEYPKTTKECDRDAECDHGYCHRCYHGYYHRYKHRHHADGCWSRHRYHHRNW